MGQGRNRYSKTQLDMEMGCKMVATKVQAQVPYCDVILKVEDAAFFSSRLILGAWSPYFDEMFGSGDREAAGREVPLPGVSKTGFRGVWEFLHGPEFFMDGEEGTLAVLRDARFLGIRHLESIVSRRLIEMLELRNAFLFLRAAMELGEKELEEGVLRFMAGCFSRISTLPGFLQMSLEALKALILRDDLDVRSEEEVFEASRRWVGHERDRKEFLPEVLAVVRLPLLSFEFLKKNVIADPLVKGDLRCDRVISEAKNYHIPELRDMVPVAMTIKRGTEYHGIEASKQMEMRSESTEIQADHAFFLAKSKDMERQIARVHLKYLKCEDITDHPFAGDEFSLRCLTAIENRLYVVGGGDFEIFELDTMSWNSGPVPPTNALKSSCASSLASIFVCGGIEDDNFPSKSVYGFDLEGQKWTRLPEMIYPRSRAPAVLKDSTLHVIGGHDGTSAIAAHERLDVRQGNWEKLAPLPSARWGSAAAIHNEQLHVAGGYTLHTRRRELFVYDERADEWMQLPSMSEGRFNHGLVSFEGGLHAVGGYENFAVEVFRGSEWEVVGELRYDSCEQACLVGSQT